MDEEYLQRRRDELKSDIKHTLDQLRQINDNRFIVMSEYKVIDNLIGLCQDVYDRFDEITNIFKREPEDQWSL